MIPGNEGSGYVLRRLLRRAIRHGMRLGIDEPFLPSSAACDARAAGRGLSRAWQGPKGLRATRWRKRSPSSCRPWRQRPGRSQDAIDAAHDEGRDRLDGETVFRLYDTYGLPLEMIRDIAEEEQVGLDEAGFGDALTRQRQRSRDAAGESQQRLEAVREALKGAHGQCPTEFTGYDALALAGARVEGLAPRPTVGSHPNSLGAGRPGRGRSWTRRRSTPSREGSSVTGVSSPGMAAARR